ncbi:MAG TPA: Crp/Fnr family transcriptional regulator [Candidatus Fraserbacteria bacterium]|nr:Crp/Fnr family transcriptional regulator [Candidatus Fraserbacteria bacterium]
MAENELHFCPVCEQGCSHLLAGLSREGLQEWEEIVHSSRPLPYAKGETIYHDGMPAMGVYIVCTGIVKVMKRNTGGKSQILKLVGPGEFLGEESLFGEGIYRSYSQALLPTQVKMIERRRFLGFLARYQQFGLRLTAKLALEVQAFQDRLLEASYESCKEKVARLLLRVAHSYGQHDLAGRWQLEMPRADLAQMTGISLETAIRTLSRFQERGWLRLDSHRITILRPEELEKLVEPFETQVQENVV